VKPLPSCAWFPIPSKPENRAVADVVGLGDVALWLAIGAALKRLFDLVGG
jgi:hypothetical protein